MKPNFDTNNVHRATPDRWPDMPSERWAPTDDRAGLLMEARA